MRKFLSGLLAFAIAMAASFSVSVAPAFAEYDEAMVVTYTFGALGCSGGNSTRKIRGPKGLKGNVALITGLSTTSFVGTTTPGKLQVGDGVTANKYGEISMGAAGAGTASGSIVVANTYATGLLANNPASLPFVNMAADTDVTITCVAPTGGAPAGVADYTIVVRWF